MFDDYIQTAGPIFEAVLESNLFDDGKIFVDSIPKKAPEEILQEFKILSKTPSFDLKRFIHKNFILPPNIECAYDAETNMAVYIDKTWDLLRRDMSKRQAHSTLIPLPKPQIVPGGRFRECFYWDSYFTALGLPIEYIKDTAINMGYLIDLFGFVPNGNRTYFETRSQPPFFSFLLILLCENNEELFAKQFVEQLKKEYQYWMSCSGFLSQYLDTKNGPRPEAYKKEKELARQIKRTDLFYSLRSACASGWDFSSRWLKDFKHFETIEILDILPVDLNAYIYHLEKTLYRFTKEKMYLKKAEKRAYIIQTIFWKDDFFYDVYKSSQSPKLHKTLAGIAPLFVKAASQKQASICANIIEKHFLKPGGFVTTLVSSSHQWDSPNGWAPLQWMTVIGLMNYGYSDLALRGAKNWLFLNEDIFKKHHTLFEKYNVIDCSTDVAKGEYAPQYGFGWTNGVAKALMKLIETKGY